MSTKRLTQQQKQQLFKKRKLKRLSEVKDIFFKTAPVNLHHHSKNESIFSPRFLTLLSEQLGTAPDFLAMRAAERRLHANRIQELLLIETDWKVLISKSRYEENLLKQMYTKEMEQFVNTFNLHFYPPEDVTHKQKVAAYSSEKTKEFCRNLLKFLKEKNPPFLKNCPWDVVLRPSNLDIITQNVLADIEPEHFFKDIVKICMKKAHDNRINIEKTQKYYQDELTNPFLFVKRTSIMYPIQHSVVMFLSMSAITHLKTIIPKFKFPPEQELLNFFNNLFKVHLRELMTKQNWYRDTYNITIILIELFSICGLVIKRDQVYNSSNQRTDIIFWLQHKLENTVPFSHHLPRIIPPKKVDTAKNLKANLTPYHKGESSVSPTELTIQSLNLAQKKAFKVNPMYIEFLDLIHNNKEIHCKETPFPTSTDLQESFGELESWDKSVSVSSLQRYIHKTTLTHINSLNLLEFKNRNQSYLKSLGIAEVTQVELDINHKKKLTWDKYSVEKAKRQILQTSLTIARMYEDFPIYFGTKLDFRSRMYPWEYLLSRTTGELKQLLCDYDSKPLNTDGLQSLLTAYYRFSLEISVAWNLFLEQASSDEKTFRKELGTFFHKFNYENYKNTFDCEDKLAYVLTLHTTLVGVFQEKSEINVDITLEIDQVCSGIMLLAMLLRIKPLAEESNVLGGPPRDIYQYIMDRIPNYFESATYEKDGTSFEFDKDRVLKFLSTNRACTKAVLMRWSYSQGHKNRERLILMFFKEYYSSSATSHEYETIEAFATQFDSFMETYFPKISQQKAYLEKVLDIRLNAGQNITGMNLRTIDGSAISWSVAPTTTINKGVWNPLANKPDTFKITIPEEESEGGTADKKAQKDLKRGLFPNLIHSIDAAIMRIVIYRVWLRTRYLLNQLHDCFLCHPNIASAVFSVLEEVYTDGTLENLVDKTFFEPMKEGLSKDAQYEIDEIREQFHTNGDSFIITKDSFVVENAYVWEGSVKQRALYIELEKIRKRDK